MKSSLVSLLTTLRRAGALVALQGLTLTAVAQNTGPVVPPPARPGQSLPEKQAPPARDSAPTAPPDSGSGLRREKPAMPVEEIIAKFAAKEAEFRDARQNYTYTQVVRVEDVDFDGTVRGRFEQKSDIIFTPEGKRYERITFAPPNTLQRLSMTKEDMQDIETVNPFVLTSEDLPKYTVEYVGMEQVDYVDTYVFDIKPRGFEKGKRYFEGRLWVDQQDLQVVKMYGKSTGFAEKRGKQEQLFPRFETYRENIDGKYWFPVYTKADDVLNFPEGPIRVRITVRYTNYKQFKTTVRILKDAP